MRCYICDFLPEDNPGTNNMVFIDRKTDREICQICWEEALSANLEFEEKKIEPTGPVSSTVS